MEVLSLKKTKAVAVAFSLTVGLFVLYGINKLHSSNAFHPQLPQKAINGSHCTQMTERFILILIMSAPFHMKERQTIRKTWLSFLINNSVTLAGLNKRAMKNPTNNASSMVIHYWFVCGHYRTWKVEAAVEEESKVYGDILRLEYTEEYSLLLHKTLESLRFASTVDVQFIVKVDDDVYLHVPRMIWFLKYASLPEKLYAGYLLNQSKAIRNPRHKWYVGEENFKDTFFPPYCNGPFYILSKCVLHELLKAASGVFLLDRLFPLEDVYIGILAKRAGIRPVQLKDKGVRIQPRFPRNLEKNWKDDTLNQFFALGHGFSSDRMIAFHERFLNLSFVMPAMPGIS